MKTMKVKCTFTEEVLGMSPANPEIHREFIASKAPDALTTEEEVATIGAEEVFEKGITVFPKDEKGRPFLYDYQIRGFFKDACGMLSRCAKKDPATGKKKPCNESSKLKAYKKEIDGLIFVLPRQIPFIFKETRKDEDKLCQRPLRAETLQGPRVALASSETVPAGAVIEFEVVLLSDEHEAAVREWLDYGALRGMGQWRNSGKGKFTWEEIC